MSPTNHQPQETISTHVNFVNEFIGLYESLCRTVYRIRGRLNSTEAALKGAKLNMPPLEYIDLLYSPSYSMNRHPNARIQHARKQRYRAWVLTRSQQKKQ